MKLWIFLLNLVPCMALLLDTRVHNVRGTFQQECSVNISSSIKAKCIIGLVERRFLDDRAGQGLLAVGACGYKQAVARSEHEFSLCRVQPL